MDVRVIVIKKIALHDDTWSHVEDVLKKFKHKFHVFTKEDVPQSSDERFYMIDNGTISLDDALNIIAELHDHYKLPTLSYGQNTGALKKLTARGEGICKIKLAPKTETD